MSNTMAENEALESPAGAVESAPQPDAGMAENTAAEAPAAASAENTPPKSLLETVKDALVASSAKQKDGDGGESAPDSTEGKDGQPDDPPEGTDEQGKEAEDAKGKGKRFDARIKQLVTERDAYKSRAEQWDQFSQWAKSSGLQADELAETLAVAQMVKQSPHEALAILRNVVATLEKQTGHELPADLQARVDSGMIDEETARELSVIRSKASLIEAQRAQERERQAAEADFQARQNLAASIGKSVTDLERSLEKSDPDYVNIKGLVKSKVVELMHEEGVPTSAADAVAQVTRAVKLVKNDLKAMLPQRRATKPVPTGSIHGQSGARPATALEAARMVLNGQAPRY